MKNYSLGRLFGVDLYINSLLIWFLVFCLIFRGFAQTILITLIFFCVLLHEFGHVLMARYYKINCKQIVLTPLGGIAFLDLPRGKNYRPLREFFIAVAGPLVTLAIYGILLSCFKDYSMLYILAKINLLLFLFNLIPAYPMDGGRIFKSIVSLVLNYKQAGRLAGAVGMGMGCLMVIFFLKYFAFTGALIGIFIILSAYAEFRENK